MKKTIKILLIAAMIASSGFGCRESTSKVRSQQAEVAMAENLSAADKLDGNEDHVIAKCYSCALAMDGAPNITSKFHDYTVHHCSEACKERFTDKADSIVSSTRVPDAERLKVPE